MDLSKPSQHCSQLQTLESSKKSRGKFTGFFSVRKPCLLPPAASGEGNGTLLQYSCLENPMDGGAGWAAVHGVAKSRTWLSDFTFTFHFHALEKEMATHSSVLAWRIPRTGEPGGLPSMGSHRVGHDRSDLAAAAAPGYSCLENPMDREAWQATVHGVAESQT